jgi:nicotinate-nucleotide adenylyltransferase
MADEVSIALGLSQMRLIPAGNPYHRPADAQPAPRLQRLAMARLGAAQFPGLKVDPREALYSTPSYTFDTLTGLREELGTTPILLLLGTNTFATLTAWKRWPELFGLAHIIVVARPGYKLPESLPAALAGALASRETDDPGLLSTGVGRIYRQAVTPHLISATQIRARVRGGRSLEGMVPPAVAEYIQSHNLYRS